MPDNSGSSRLAARAKVFSCVAAIFVFLIGGLVLWGWLFEIEVLKRISGGITMKANTAVCLMLAAASVVALQRRTQKNYKAFGQLCANAESVGGLA